MMTPEQQAIMTLAFKYDRIAADVLAATAEIKTMAPLVASFADVVTAADDAARMYRRTATALRLLAATGVEHCVCCHSPKHAAGAKAVR